MTQQATVPPHELRARFARGLSELYGREVPAYTTLVDVSQQVNTEVLAERGSAAERLGDIARVTAERHGAIRVGTPEELAQVARVFGAVGMYPTGFYDLREAAPSPCPSSPRPSARSTRRSWPATPSGSSPPCWCPRTGASSTRSWRQSSRSSCPPAGSSPRSCWSWPTAPSPTAGWASRRPNASWSWPPEPSRCPANRWTAPGTPRWSRSPVWPPTSAASAPPTSTI